MLLLPPRVELAQKLLGVKPSRPTAGLHFSHCHVGTSVKDNQWPWYVGRRKSSLDTYTCSIRFSKWFCHTHVFARHLTSVHKYFSLHLCFQFLVFLLLHYLNKSFEDERFAANSLKTKDVPYAVQPSTFSGLP